jgi:hypothetical protein
MLIHVNKMTINFRLEVLSLLLVPAIVVTAGGCKALDGLVTVSQSQPAGFIELDGSARGSTFALSPTALFYRTIAAAPQTYSTAGTPNDACAITPPDEGFFPAETNDLVAAGAFVTMQLSGALDTLTNPFGSPHAYALPSSTVAFNPGDSVTFRITGDANGFPASTLTMKTVEAFSVSTPLVYPPNGQDMTLVWTAPKDKTNQLFTVQIPFAISSRPEDAHQIYCQFVDDGQASVPIALLRGIPGSQSGLAVNIHLKRIRAALVVQPGTGAILNAVSTFSVPNAP